MRSFGDAGAVVAVFSISVNATLRHNWRMKRVSRITTLSAAMMVAFGLVSCGTQEQTVNPTLGSSTQSTLREAPTGDLSSLQGTTISLDPGHAGTPPPVSDMVTDGRGGLKPCNTSGTAASDGWPEHTFNWLITGQIASILEENGATVLLSREDDSERAACIDERAYIENDSDADAVLSLHADGNTEGNRGFHLSAISDPLPENDADGSTKLAESLQSAMLSAGFEPSNYLGVDGLYPRSDLTGLNLSTKPKVLVEFGNMQDSTDFALLSSEEDRERLAEAIAAGLANFLQQ